MDVWILTWHPHYTAATIVPPEMIYGLALLRNGQIIAFVPMMITNQPIVEWDQKRFKRELRHLIVEAGRAAYRAGIPISNCPSFVDEDMAIDWRIGWRAERESLPSGHDRRVLGF